MNRGDVSVPNSGGSRFTPVILCKKLYTIISAARPGRPCWLAACSDRQVIEKQVPLPVKPTAEHIEDKVLEVLGTVGGTKGQTFG